MIYHIISLVYIELVSKTKRGRYSTDWIWTLCLSRAQNVNVSFKKNRSCNHNHMHLPNQQLGKDVIFLSFIFYNICSKYTIAFLSSTFHQFNHFSSFVFNHSKHSGSVTLIKSLNMVDLNLFKSIGVVCSSLCI